MKYGCIAAKLGHSFSREIHAALADYEYELCEISSEELDGFMTRREFCAINVTIPYKEAVIPYLDEIDEHAKTIGAVNTIVNRDGRLYGYNTDFFGMCSLLDYAGISLHGRKVLILGTGGTSKTAWAVAEALGAKEVYKVSRTAKDGAITYEDAYALHGDAEIILNTTPVGMYPNIYASPIDIDRFPALCGVADAIYNPLRSELIQRAEAKEIPAVGGLYMLVAQAALACEKFIGGKISRETIEQVYRQIHRSKENIVLTGMPGCGKTTTGRELAQKLGWKFIDTDDAILARIGMSIPEYFAAHGEAAFRQVEAQVIAEEIAPLTSAVIATGGGAILRAENVVNLKRNGCIFFLDRPLEQIRPTVSRPLSMDRQALEKRYQERYPIYSSTCDVHIHTSHIRRENVNTILEKVKP
ncbi:MAG: AAA family ATPase [Clostridia bacterium]|nr:AAA family ATPase [Clostridia bacterium]